MSLVAFFHTAGAAPPAGRPQQLNHAGLLSSGEDSRRHPELPSSPELPGVSRASAGPVAEARGRGLQGRGPQGRGPQGRGLQGLTQNRGRAALLHRHVFSLVFSGAEAASSCPSSLNRHAGVYRDVTTLRRSRVSHPASVRGASVLSRKCDQVWETRLAAALCIRDLIMSAEVLDALTGHNSFMAAPPSEYGGGSRVLIIVTPGPPSLNKLLQLDHQSLTVVNEVSRRSPRKF